VPLDTYLDAVLANIELNGDAVMEPELKRLDELLAVNERW